MIKLKEQNAVTLIALVITIMVLGIIITISFTQGNSLIKKAKAENIETNMLTIKAKAKEYLEDVDALNWASKSDNKDDKYDGLSTKEGKNRKEFQEKYSLILVENKTATWYKDGYTYYSLGEQALKQMGLEKLWQGNQEYVIRYPLEDGNTDGLELDIIYTTGITYEGTTYYNLSDLQEVL